VGVRALLTLALAFGVGWFLRRLLTPAHASGPAARQSVPVKSMVRDRICNTFVPRESALSTDLEGERHFFCSERCRKAFLAQH
jgi:YHS domain-containing protein